MECRICGNRINNNKIYIAREMMFGDRDTFTYFQCSLCNCLQISEIPNNLFKYYNQKYYSFRNTGVARQNLLEHFLRIQRTKYFLGGGNFLGRSICKLYGPPKAAPWLRKTQLELTSKILDVGCGKGHLLLYLMNQGFSNLSGVDPYIDRDLHFQNGVKIHRMQLSEINGVFDFIMFNHSFEHMADPVSSFKEIRQKLVDKGLVMIRTPTVSSFAWEKYRTHWVQLDAPRHLHLCSIASIEYLAATFGFIVEDVEFDSNEFQFWGSEQYVRDIALMDETSYWINPQLSIFSKAMIREYRRLSKELNQEKKGDQACFFLRKE